MFLEKGTRWQKNGSVKLYGLFFVDGVQLPQGYGATTGRQFTFYQHVPRNSWYSFDRPWKDERLSRPWNYQVGLNMGPLNWKSSALTSYTLFRKFLGILFINYNFVKRKIKKRLKEAIG